MKRFFILSVLLASAATATAAFAETVVLNSGREIEGKITEQTDDYIRVDMGIGVLATYYIDEINTIDGKKIQASEEPAVAQEQGEIEEASPLLAEEAPPAQAQPFFAPEGQDESQEQAVESPDDQAENALSAEVFSQDAPVSEGLLPEEPENQDIIAWPETEKEIAPEQEDQQEAPQAQEASFAGTWKENCSSSREIAMSIEKAEDGLYAISMCRGSGPCFKIPGTRSFTDGKDLRIIDQNTLESVGARSPTTYHRCSDEPIKNTSSGWLSFGFGVLLSVIAYIYYSFCLYLIAKKTNTQQAWLAWVPVINFLVLPLLITRMSLMWLVLAVLAIIPMRVMPLLGFMGFSGYIIFAIVVTCKICTAVGKPWWLGLLMCIPVVGLVTSPVIWGYLAFSKE